MAAYEVLLLNTAVPQIQAAQAGDTYVCPRDIQITANLDVTGNTILGDTSTDTVQVNGYMSTGGAVNASFAMYPRNTALTGTTQAGVYSAITGASDATSAIYGVVGDVRTAATAFTVTNVSQFFAADATKGAGSTITNQHGVRIADQTNGTNNFGITSLVSSGTNKWNIYASGTASNYFAGNVGIGGTSTTFGKLNTQQIVSAAYTPDIYLNGSHTAGNISHGVAFSINGYGASAGVYCGDQTGASTLQFTSSSSYTTPNQIERLRIGATEAVFNDPGNDYDFRVESDTNTHALFVDAGNSRVGIGTSSPLALMHASAPLAAGTIVNVGMFSQASGTDPTVGQGARITLAANSSITRCAAIEGVHESGTNAHYLAFLTSADFSNPAERLRIKSTGQTRFVPLAADPAGAQAGDVYYNSGTNKLRLYDGTSWVDLN